jgi:hypothetical protein
MKVIVAGGRDFNDYTLLKQKCNEVLSNYTDVEIVSGGADGADKLGELYAKDFGYQLKRFPANWNKFGPSAGMIRNREMAEYADILIAFWDETSKGTSNMIKVAKELNLNVNVFIY